MEEAQLRHVADAPAQALGQEQEQGEQDQGGADDDVVPHPDFDVLFEAEPKHGYGDGRGEDRPGQPRVRSVAEVAVSQSIDSGGDQLADVGGKVDEDRGQGTELNGGGKVGAGIGPPEKTRDDVEMSGTADGNEFGQSLDETEEECLK